MCVCVCMRGGLCGSVGSFWVHPSGRKAVGGERLKFLSLSILFHFRVGSMLKYI